VYKSPNSTKTLIVKLVHGTLEYLLMNEDTDGSFQVCDALSILFKLEKPLTEHLEGFILLSREGGEL
jgi:hypothetical protein